jgi:hypothetical protein
MAHDADDPLIFGMIGDDATIVMDVFPMRLLALPLTRAAVIVVLGILIAACQPQPTPIPPPLPTLAQLPTLTPTDAPTATPLPQIAAAQPTDAPPTATISMTPTVTTITPPENVPIPTLPPVTAVANAVSAPMDAIARLRAIPILSNIDTDAVRAIYVRGQANGMRATVFTTVGDSNTTNGDFLQPIGVQTRNYCTWGAYADLQNTVDYFSTPPIAGASNSFTHESAAARMGFNTAAVLDPFWASSATCQPGESSLTCEYRRTNPAIAVIMLGGIDMRELSPTLYAANMEQIIVQSIDAGVIPVLTTFIILPERPQYEASLYANIELLEIAARYQTPLINLWAAAEALPDHGIGPDRNHLKARVGSYCDFSGAERELGGTLRNLLTLQMLDALRRAVLE